MFSAHLGTCINTIGDTILMVVEPWFSHEVGKDFRKRENGGEEYYHDMEEGVNPYSSFDHS